MGGGTERLFRIIKQLINILNGPYPMCNASLDMTWIPSTYEVCLITSHAIRVSHTGGGGLLSVIL